MVVGHNPPLPAMEQLDDPDDDHDGEGVYDNFDEDGDEVMNGIGDLEVYSRTHPSRERTMACVDHGSDCWNVSVV